MKQKSILVCVCIRVWWEVGGGAPFILLCMYIPNSFKKQPIANECM